MGSKSTKHCVNDTCEHYNPYITMQCDECTVKHYYNLALQETNIDKRIDLLIFL
jgi:hypothetical protein